MKSLYERFGKENLFSEKRQIVLGSKSRKFRKDIFNQEWLDPHEEMEKCKEMYNTNGLVSSAVDSLTDFFMGNDMSVSSENKNTEIFFQKMIDKSNPDMFETAREGIEQAIKVGNGYVEIDWDTQKKLPVKFYPVPDGSRIYINSDPYGYPLKKKRLNPVTLETEEIYNLDEYYILSVPETFKTSFGDGMKVKRYNLSYTFGAWREVYVKGMPIHKDKLIHFKWGLSDNGLYGRAFLASVIDDHDILKRVEKAMGLIAKYKAVPKKLIFPAEGEEFSSEDSEELAMYLQGLEDDENAVSPKRVSVSDLSYAGKDIQMGTTADHCRRKIVSGLTPEFLIGYGMDTNKATAGQLMVAFMLRLETKRRLWSKQWTRVLVGPYRKYYPGLAEAKIKFGELDFRTPIEKNNEIRARWQSNQITFNEMRKQMGESTVKGGNIFYKDFISMGVNEDEISIPKPNVAPNPVKVGTKFNEDFKNLKEQKLNSFTRGKVYRFNDEKGIEHKGIWEGNIDKWLNDDVVLILRDVDEKSKLYKVKGSILKEKFLPKEGTVEDPEEIALFPKNPTGTKTLEKELARKIRGIYKDARRELLDTIETHRESLQKHILVEGGISGNIFGAINKVLGKIEMRGANITNFYVGKVARKTHDRVSEFMGQPFYHPYDDKLVEVLKQKTFANVKGLTEEIKKKLIRELSRSVVQGTSVGEVKEIIKDNMNIANSRAELIARNELISTANETTINTAQRAGVKKFKWITAWDDRVCSGKAFKIPVVYEGKSIWNCRDMRGKVFGIGPKMPRPIESSHISCRCSLTPVID